MAGLLGGGGGNNGNNQQPGKLHISLPLNMLSRSLEAAVLVLPES
jgi:hypothetical protein